MQSGTASRMIQAMDAQSSVERLRQAFKGRERGVAAVYLFGSVARGESRPGSDLDVAVLLEPAPERGAYESLRLDLRAELESRLGQEIDFVVLNHAPPDLVHRVLRDSVLVIEPRPVGPGCASRCGARNEYWDLKPYLDEYRRTPGVPRLTDADLVRKRLAFIETCLRELAEFADAERVEHDVRERRFVEHTLQIAIQAALDIASHVVASDRLGEPSSNQELFEILERAGWVTPRLASGASQDGRFPQHPGPRIPRRGSIHRSRRAGAPASKTSRHSSRQSGKGSTTYRRSEGATRRRRRALRRGERLSDSVNIGPWIQPPGIAAGGGARATPVGGDGSASGAGTDRESVKEQCSWVGGLPARMSNGGTAAVRALRACGGAAVAGWKPAHPEHPAS